MRSLLKTKLAAAKDEAGAALALVLILVVFISLLAASVGVFSQSSRLIIATNIEQSSLRSSLVSNALEQALRDLSFKPGTTTDRRWGMDVVCNTTPEANCVENTCKNNVLGPYNGISVQCFEKRESGIQRPLATYVLTGSDCGSTCVIGEDMGLRIKNSFGQCDSNNQPTPAGNVLKVNGGVLNSSGKWVNVACETLQLVQSADSFNRGITPQIIQPSNLPCPTVSYLANAATVSVVRSNMCASEIDAANLSSTGENSQVRSYLDSVAGRISPVSGTASTTKGNCVATGANADTTPYDTSLGGPAVLWSPGVLGSAQIALLNEQIANCIHPIVFTKGAYRLVPGTTKANGQPCDSARNNNTLSTDLLCANTIYMTNSSAKIIAGVPKNLSSATPTCDYDAGSTEVQFSGNSYLYMTGGLFVGCSSYAPVIAAPISATTVNFTRNNTGNNLQAPQPFITLTGGSLTANGLLFAPAGYADITLAQANYLSFSKGAILRAMTLTENPSSPEPTQIDPPPLYNGDRVVQLRFYCSIGDCGGLKSNYLGMVQLVIQDYFGRKPNSGYKILTWRTLW